MPQPPKKVAENAARLKPHGPLAEMAWAAYNEPGKVAKGLLVDFPLQALEGFGGVALNLASAIGGGQPIYGSTLPKPRTDSWANNLKDRAANIANAATLGVGGQLAENYERVKSYRSPEQRQTLETNIEDAIGAIIETGFDVLPFTSLVEAVTGKDKNGKLLTTEERAKAVGWAGLDAVASMGLITKAGGVKVASKMAMTQVSDAAEWAKKVNTTSELAAKFKMDPDDFKAALLSSSSREEFLTNAKLAKSFNIKLTDANDLRKAFTEGGDIDAAIAKVKPPEKPTVDMVETMQANGEPGRPLAADILNTVDDQRPPLGPCL